MSAPLIRFDKVGFGYAAGEPLLSDVSFSVQHGHAVALLGPNGVGKTTLLRVGLGWLAPQSGAVLITGKHVRSFQRRELGQILALVPQDEHLPFDYSLREYVLLGRTPHLGAMDLPKSKDRRIADAALGTVGLTEIAERSVAVLSAGERQLLLLARAIAQEPRALLLDEPSSHLDIGNKARLFGLLRELQRSGTTLLFTTHDPQFAMNLADAVVVMKDGRVRAAGTPVSTLRTELLSETYRAPIEVVHTARGPAIFWDSET